MRRKPVDPPEREHEVILREKHTPPGADPLRAAAEVAGFVEIPSPRGVERDEGK